MPYLITFAISGAKVNIFFELCKCVRIFFVFFFKKISILFAYLKNFSYLCIGFRKSPFRGHPFPQKKDGNCPLRIGQIGPINYARRERLMVVLDHTYYNMLVIR